MSGISNAPADMNMLRQVRRALGDIDCARGDPMKVYYLTHCLRDMVARGNRSWSEYRPMVAEEFE